MPLEQGSLERRQLAVEVGGCPLTGTITISVHGSHSSSDGGGNEKLVRRSGVIRMDKRAQNAE